MNFKEQFINGEVGYSELQRKISQWSPGVGNCQTLMEYLGLTEQEYSAISHGESIERALIEQRTQQGFRIYQLEFTSDIQPKKFAFKGIEALHKEGYEQPPASEYRLVSDSELLHIAGLPIEDVLNRIFSRFSNNLPSDYYGRSVAPSDVIELYGNEGRRYYYCDGKGKFAEVKFSPMLALPLKTQAS